MLGRGRREDRRDERQEDRNDGILDRGATNTNRYQMQQRMVSIGDDFWIENQLGQKLFKVDGKALRVRQTLIFENNRGVELCKIQERVARIRESIAIEGPRGEKLAEVKKAMITPLRERFTVSVRGGPDMEVQGNLLDHEYRIELHGRRVAEVSKKWFRLRDSYGVEIDPGQDDILILAATVAIDEMVHPA
jgi:uncharacterized protein YxjI